MPSTTAERRKQSQSRRPRASATHGRRTKEDIVVTDEKTPPSPEGATWVWCTPEMAAEMLAHNKVNRDMKRSEVESYIRLMKDGLWGTCVEPLVFDEDGNLINGQHRLTAQIEAGTSHWWLILKGVPKDTAKTVNGGSRNALKAILKYNGEKNYMILAGVANNTYQWAHGLMGISNRVTPLEGEQWLAEHGDLRHSCDVASHVANVSVIDVGPTVLGTAHWIIAQTNGHAEADLFLYRMAHLQGERPGSGIIALLNRLNKAQRGEKVYRHQIRDQVAAIVKVWNWEVEGRFVKRLQIVNKSGWVNPVPLKKEKPIDETELPELLSQVPDVSDVVPEDPDDVIDEGEEK